MLFMVYCHKNVLTVLNKEVSSAYIIKLNILLAFGKSCMYIINNKGPKINACGTPTFINKFDILTSII